LNKNLVWLVFLLAISVSIGVGIMVQQYLVWHSVWNINQTLHHEFFASILFAFSVGIGVAIFALRSRKKA